MERTKDLLKLMNVPTEQFVKILEMDPADHGMEERFIYVELTECHHDEQELRETVEYLSKPICREGELTIQGSHYYLGNHRLMNNEEFEFVIDGTWCRSWVITVQNEDHIELFGLSPKKDHVWARMRG